MFFFFTVFMLLFFFYKVPPSVFYVNKKIKQNISLSLSPFIFLPVCIKQTHSRSLTLSPSLPLIVTHRKLAVQNVQVTVIDSLLQVLASHE